MNLNKVTITGADDSTNIHELVELSASYPFVEWGILVSKRHTAHDPAPRWPTNGWMDEFSLAAAAGKLNVAMHICGEWVREIYMDQMDWSKLPPVWRVAQRVQLNTHAVPHLAASGWWTGLPRIEGVPREWIFQLDGVNNVLMRVARHYGVNASGLFDLSHGAGILPTEWPRGLVGVPCGYAGGLGPENVAEQLMKIEWAAICPYWIDMERRVRTEDDSALDMAKVRMVLEATREFQKNGGSANDLA